MTLAQRLRDSYRAYLHENVLSGTAPDGTEILQVPFRLWSSANIEFAIWREDGQAFISDCGFLLHQLDVAGVDVDASEKRWEWIRSALSIADARIEGGVVLRTVTADELAPPVLHDLVEAIRIAAAVAYDKRETPEHERPLAYRVQSVLSEVGVTARQGPFLLRGGTGRRYPVDFVASCGVRGEPRHPGAIVLFDQRNLLEQAERWNFRFRDIHSRLGRLRRFVVVSTDGSWSHDAEITIRDQVDQVFRDTALHEVGSYFAAARNAPSSP